MQRKRVKLMEGVDDGASVSIVSDLADGASVTADSVPAAAAAAAPAPVAAPAPSGPPAAADLEFVASTAAYVAREETEFTATDYSMVGSVIRGHTVTEAGIKALQVAWSEYTSAESRVVVNLSLIKAGLESKELTHDVAWQQMLDMERVLLDLEQKLTEAEKPLASELRYNYLCRGGELRAHEVKIQDLEQKLAAYKKREASAAWLDEAEC